MNESRSWLLNSAAKISQHRHIAGKLAAGFGLASLILVGQFEPAFAQEKSEADRKIEALIPLPEPANVPPLTADDVKQDSGATASTPAPAVTPAPAPAQTATPAPAQAATPPAAPAPQPAQQTSTPATDAAPQLSAEEIKKLTGKDLAKAPLAASLSSADHGIALKLREVLATRADRFFDRRDELKAAEAFYRDRGFAPLWLDNASTAARTKSAAQYLSGIGADGLDPADYPVPSFNAADAQSLAEAELRFTHAIFDYARHAQTGRVHFSRMSGDVHYELDFPDPAATLTKMAAASDLAPVLDAFNPQHPQYKALKAKLAEARGGPVEKEVVRIPEGPTLKLGMEDSRVALLRRRLNVPGSPDDWRFDKAVAEAVQNFQKNAGLTADGLAGGATIRAINGPHRGNKADAILATMERWRWMPRDLGRNHSILNIPDFTLKVVKNGAVVWQTRVVVGKNATKTPLISDTMKFITVNPTWNVPPSIIANEYLPALQQDPSVLERMGLRLEENRDGTVRIYQPPGDANALGRLRFNFPNKFLVYQHDTPDKNLFARDVRAYSHGCMRVQDPVKYAEVLLSITLPGDNYSQERIRGMFGPSEQNINFPRPLPVHITYQTAYVDDAGKLVIRDDIYGHDTALMAALKGGERRVADVPISRKQASFSREELRLPNGTYFGGGGGNYAGGRYSRNPVEDFFRSIFR